jgi:hypothetical protein
MWGYLLACREAGVGVVTYKILGFTSQEPRNEKHRQWMRGASGSRNHANTVSRTIHEFNFKKEQRSNVPGESAEDLQLQTARTPIKNIGFYKGPKTHSSRVGGLAHYRSTMEVLRPPDESSGKLMKVKRVSITRFKCETVNSKIKIPPSN